MLPDPLRINYLLVLADDKLEEATPFQGFGQSWRGLIWAFELLAQLPADLLEPAQFGSGLIAQRMGGMRQLLWSPISISPLEQLGAKDFGPFLILMSSDPATAERVERWRTGLGVPALHISATGAAGSIAADAFGFEALLEYCRQVMAVRGEELSPARRAAVERALPQWMEPIAEAVDLKAWLHNITLPNLMVLARARRKGKDPEGFVGASEADYRTIIADSVRAVAAVREEVGFMDFHRLSLIRPALYLVEPAFYRHAYARFPSDGVPDRATFDMLRRMQTQRGLFNQIDGGRAEALLASAEAQQLIAVRGEELNAFTAGIGLKAAQTNSAVMRLSPAVNHVFPLLGNFARNVRATSPHARLKTPRIFATIQEALADAVGAERIKLIEEVGGPVKVISDAPIELLPVDGLPLMFRYLCSRIGATPGNVLMGQLAISEPITVSPEQLNKVLIISSFADDDPLRDMLTGAVGTLMHRLLGKVEVTTVRVSSRAEMIAALNASDASILIFDGHGRGNADTSVATLRVGTEDVDVWHLRGEARIPPIVILSACDTQGIDASSHATVGTGFLAAGALTVLATLLPVDGRASAAFVARLLFRLAEFIPAALKGRRRVLNWTEVVSGMQQMMLSTELLHELVGRGDQKEWERLHTLANAHINGGDGSWYEWLLETIAEHRGDGPERIASRAQAVIARSEAIRYIQLGSPENILIDDGTVRNELIPREIRKLIDQPS